MNIHVLIMVLSLYGDSVTTIEQQFDNEIACRAAMEKVKQDLAPTNVDVNLLIVLRNLFD